MKKIEDRERRIIDESTYNEANPWLERTEWAKYLRKLDRDELLQSVATPEMDEEPILSGRKNPWQDLCFSQSAS